MRLIDLLSAATDTSGEPQHGSQRVRSKTVTSYISKCLWFCFQSFALQLYIGSCTSQLQLSTLCWYQNVFAELQRAICFSHRAKCSRVVIQGADVQVDFGWLLKAVSSDGLFRKWKLASHVETKFRNYNEKFFFSLPWKLRCWSNPRTPLWCDPFRNHGIDLNRKFLKYTYLSLREY